MAGLESGGHRDIAVQDWEGEPGLIAGRPCPDGECKVWLYMFAGLVPIDILSWQVRRAEDPQFKLMDEGLPDGWKNLLRSGSERAGDTGAVTQQVMDCKLNLRRLPQKYARKLSDLTGCTVHAKNILGTKDFIILSGELGIHELFSLL